MTVNEVRQLVASNRPEEGQPGYPEVVRAAVVEHALAARERGRTWQAIGDEVGVSSTTVRSWTLRQQESPGFAQVLAASCSCGEEQRPAVTSQPSSAVLETPAGFTVRGLSVADLAELLVVLG